jgi:hypothetical protein
MCTSLRITAWSVVAVASLVFVLFVCAVWVEYYVPGVGRRVADAVGLGSPSILALWVLFLGCRYGNSRGAVIVYALVAGIFMAVQNTLLGFLFWYCKGFGNTERARFFELLLATSVGADVVLFWWCAYRALRRHPRGCKNSSTRR